MGSAKAAVQRKYSPLLGHHRASARKQWRDLKKKLTREERECLGEVIRFAYNWGVLAGAGADVPEFFLKKGAR